MLLSVFCIPLRGHINKKCDVLQPFVWRPWPQRGTLPRYLQIEHHTTCHANQLEPKKSKPGKSDCALGKIASHGFPMQNNETVPLQKKATERPKKYLPRIQNSGFLLHNLDRTRWHRAFCLATVATARRWRSRASQCYIAILHNGILNIIN